MLGAAPPSPGRLSLGAAPPLPLFRERFLFNSDSSFVLHLALALANQGCPRVFRTPPSSDNQIARIFFLIILQLRTGNDLRDQADLASQGR